MNRESLYSLYRGKDETGVVGGGWLYGALDNTDKQFPRIIYFDRFGNRCFLDVKPETVGRFTDVTDKNGERIFEGDIVKFFGMVGKVVFTQSCFGIGVRELIDWRKIEKQIPLVTGYNNRPLFCENDNFISFWELLWNFNAEDGKCEVCEVIGNIYDNYELREAL